MVVHYILYLYSRAMRRLHRKAGSWQSSSFEYYHKKALFHKMKLTEKSKQSS